MMNSGAVFTFVFVLVRALALRGRIGPQALESAILFFSTVMLPSLAVSTDHYMSRAASHGADGHGHSALDRCLGHFSASGTRPLGDLASSGGCSRPGLGCPCVHVWQRRSCGKVHIQR